MLKCDTTEYVNEPAVTGGNPILANGKGIFDDMLGNSLGVIEKDKFSGIQRNAFGKVLANKAGNEYNLFTGKPQIGGLGYAFLFRNYRPSLGKWQTQDPLGYPDGWNNLAYCNNRTTDCIDFMGGWRFEITPRSSTYGYGSTLSFSSTDSVTITGSTSAGISGGGDSFSVSASINLSAFTYYYDVDSQQMEYHESSEASVNITEGAFISGDYIYPTGTSSASTSVNGPVIKYWDSELGMYIQTQCELHVDLDISGIPSGEITGEGGGFVNVICNWYYTCPVETGYSLPQDTVIYTFSYNIKE